MHVHAGVLYPQLLTAVAGIAAMQRANIAPPTGTATFQLDCGVLYATTRLQECNIATKGSPANPQVRA